ncbi:hypothetical protein PHLGIDRAFT_393337 [Phlebiopsis gigantea 11061_1 CR5-6]|uniref:Protein YAE1 n=1 Tax=Phlebiopsis gigantea (strain 11061_1 CR5-6) TaxID=745531 RepID=A0A0C3PMU9_PHLG1|nr:hypothetical protein PHLGIDRAFT_393337 [Phlebiopsis gigantea 11061_1 CR5-6]
MDTDDSPWEDNATNVRDSEWSKISSDFLNAGYREGITAGKESALQAGFDEGFAETGAPIGRSIGLMRGYISSIIAFLSSGRSLPSGVDAGQLLGEARAISGALGDVRFSDIAPPDLEAEMHAREHLGEDAADVVTSEELQEKKDMESLEDLMNRMGAGSSSRGQEKRATMDDVKSLQTRLSVLAQTLGLSLPLP